ncbi:uncharacterized protein (DUF2336 family) [Dongia mobilis]|uniref:Uncharacterized protein (DUF2336 family) n=2 Tax=Dongia mobilis TaxID=578943 RepID=A0A4R6WQ06_9PROT|nr:uncharacterized protein (DUF2336 family) [Dongia mobilis]
MLAVAGVYREAALSPEEREIAHAIINAVLPEAELDFRRRLADMVKNAPQLDAAIARRLAEDVLEVARPILAESLALSDADLVAIIDNRSIEHARVIATRRELSAELSTALIRTDDETIVLRVAANENAAIPTQAYHRILDRFGEHATITEAVVQRRALPMAVAERMTTIVTGRMLERLIDKYSLEPARVSAIIEHGRENILLTSFAPGQRAEEMRALIEALHQNGLLSSTLILRAFCLGNFAFTLPALSLKAGIQVSNVRALLGDEGRNGPAQLYERCDLDPAFRELFLQLTVLGRNERVRRFGFAPEGWRTNVRPVLDDVIGDTNPEQAFEQRITEALMCLATRYHNGDGQHGYGRRQAQAG